MSEKVMQFAKMSEHHSDGVDAAAVPAGYKRTDAGVIPVDWGVSSVGSEFQIQLGKMLDAAKNVGVPKPYLGNRAVQWGRFDLDAVSDVPMTATDLQRFRLRRNDLLVCEGGEIGRAAVWDEPIPECYYQKALHRLRPKGQYDVSLMMFFLRLWTWTGYLRNYITQTSIAHLPKDRLQAVPLPVPPSSERHAISEALSDVERLLHALDSLIAKKRAIKQTAMEQLLTGKLKLPGSSNSETKNVPGIGICPSNWLTPRLEDVCTKIQDGTHFSPKLGGSDRLYVTSRNIGFGTLDLADAEWISEDEHRKIYSRCDTRRGDLLLTKDGANTGNAALNTLNDECSLLSSVAFMRFDSRRDDARFFLQYILSFRGQKRLKEIMSGNAITRLTLQKIKDFRAPRPPLIEQQVIASVLSDMDAEIVALEGRRAKTRHIKRGMMQQLLTGRVRLVRPVQESPAA